jgi:Uma2 family endonuclease
MTDQARVRMTAKEFFNLPETNRPTELIEGELVVSPSPIPKHQITAGESYTTLRGLIPNGTLFFAPMDVYLDDENIPQPDIIWVAENSRCVIGAKRLEGPPDLIVEIYSPGTFKRDKSDKFEVYERHGVREYWMIDPLERYIEVWILDKETFVRQGVYGPGDMFISPVLDGKTVRVNSLLGI